jgi:GPH family glycoside/pentoside/hexuronide:cation symporter
MSNSVQTNKVPMVKKVAFGVGMLANQMFPAALGVFMVVLVNGFGFPVWMVAILTFAPRLLDFVIDPIMGFITDNTRSRWGKRRHYVFIGAIILGISFLFMWQIHKDNGITFNFFYFLFFKLCLYIGLTIFSIPFVAMGYEMSEDFHERTQIMAIAQWIGQWAWVIVPWFWIIIYDPTWFPSPEAGARSLSVWVAIICMLFAMVPAFFIKSASTLNETSFKSISLRNIGGIFKNLIHEFKEAFKLQDFRRLCYATFFTFNAFNTVAQFTYFIIVYYLFGGDKGNGGLWAAIFGSGGAVVTTFIVIPVVVKMSKMIGKKKAFLLSQAISIFGYIMLFFLFIPGKPYMFLFALPFFSFGIGGLFTTMMSMTADVCDVDELNYGQRRDGIFGAIYWWVVKLGFAFAGLLSYMILAAIGFNGDLPTQGENTIFWLRFSFSVVPILGTLTAIYFMWNYDITEERIKQIGIELTKRKSAPKTSSMYEPGKLLALHGAITKELGIDFKNKTIQEISQHFKQILDNGVHGLCFSPYVEGQNIGDTLTKQQISHRLQIIATHTQWIRTFSCTEGNELIPALAKEKNLKVLAGAWISNDRQRNEKEIKQLIELANNGFVDMVAVGNEVLHRNEMPLNELVGYINRIKQSIPNHIPVGYVDAYYQYLENPSLVDACDVVFVNCYPFWEGATFELSMAYLDRMVALTQQIAKNKKVIITETGWPSIGDKVQDAVPDYVNAMKYFVSVQEWVKTSNIDVFYFSSFDETWKIKQEGIVGAGWGIWDKNEQLKN